MRFWREIRRFIRRAFRPDIGGRLPLAALRSISSSPVRHDPDWQRGHRRRTSSSLAYENAGLPRGWNPFEPLFGYVMWLAKRLCLLLVIGALLHGDSNT